MARTKKEGWIETVEVNRLLVQRGIGYVMALAATSNYRQKQSIAEAAEKLGLSPFEIALLTIEIDGMLDTSESSTAVAEDEPTTPLDKIAESVDVKPLDVKKNLSTKATA